MKNPLLCALLCALLGLVWQFSTVSSNFRGNWTALFCTGSEFPTPRALAGEHIYVFAESSGYDGQFYHYVAHDPLYRGEVGRGVPDPKVRYRRILLPALAWLAAFGNPNWIDFSYIACNLLFLALGAWWLARWLVLQKAHPGYSILYALAPAVLVSLDRLTVDLAFTSLCLAFLVYLRERAEVGLYIVLALAALCRDTGFLLVAACVIAECVPRRRYRRALWFATAALPALAWNLFVNLHIPVAHTIDPMDLAPFRGLAQILVHPVRYDLGAGVRALATALDYLELMGILLAALLVLRNLYRRGFGAVEIVTLLWASAAIALPRLFWADCYSPARVFTPLLLFEALGWFAGDGVIALAPLALVTPRVALQLAPQVLGIVRGIF